MQRGYHALPNDERCFSAAKGWTRACLRWVKSGKAQNEQMLSALPPKADKEQTCGNVRFVPFATICDAAKLSLIRSPRRRAPAARATIRGRALWLLCG